MISNNLVDCHSGWFRSNHYRRA